MGTVWVTESIYGDDPAESVVEGGEQNFIDEGRVGATAALAETGADEETIEFGLPGAVLLELRRVGVEDRLD